MSGVHNIAQTTMELRYLWFTKIYNPQKKKNSVAKNNVAPKAAMVTATSDRQTSTTT